MYFIMSKGFIYFLSFLIENDYFADIRGWLEVKVNERRIQISEL